MAKIKEEEDVVALSSGDEVKCEFLSYISQNKIGHVRINFKEFMACIAHPKRSIFSKVDFNDLDIMLGVPPKCASILDVHAALDEKCLGDLVTQGKGVEVCCRC